MPKTLEHYLQAEQEGRLIETDYAYTPRVRHWQGTPGHAYLNRILARNTETYRATIATFGRFRREFEAIPVHGEANGTTPAWRNGWLPGLDAAAIYGFLAAHNPSVYMEIGSGNSTKFARRAIRDHGLKTRIISIDPCPRAEIDALCDQVIRTPCEDVPLPVFSGIPSDSVFFIDNSHRSFQNSDVTVFFTEILPAIPPGVIWSLHDIFLPHDYPGDWLDRYYNEQYLLAAYLMGGHQADDILLPAMFVAITPPLAEAVGNTLFGAPALREVERHGGCFWMRRRACTFA